MFCDIIKYIDNLKRAQRIIGRTILNNIDSKNKIRCKPNINKDAIIHDAISTKNILNGIQ